VRFEEFRATLSAGTPPAGLNAPLQSLWYAAKGDWNRAHQLVQDDNGRDAAWVHAYLHRVEGDLGNAGYWYRRADRPASTAPLDDEWAEIGKALLGAG
jgi:hypothetical protein